MSSVLRKASLDEAQDIAEYALTLAVILLIVVLRSASWDSNANTAFSSVTSSLQ